MRTEGGGEKGSEGCFKGKEVAELSSMFASGRREKGAKKGEK